MSALHVRDVRIGAYIGFAGYASVLACTKTARTDLEVSEITGIRHAQTRRLLKQFLSLRLIHRVGWQKRPHGLDAPIYLIGPGENAPASLTVDGRPMPYADHRHRLQARVVAFASLIHALEDPMTLGELERQSGIVGGRLSDLTRHLLHPDIRLIHVCAWQRRDGAPGGAPMRVMRYGPDMPDARRPRPNEAVKRAVKRAQKDIHKPAWDRLVIGLKRNAGFQSARA